MQGQPVQRVGPSTASRPTGPNFVHVVPDIARSVWDVLIQREAVHRLHVAEHASRSRSSYRCAPPAGVTVTRGLSAGTASRGAGGSPASRRPVVQLRATVNGLDFWNNSKTAIKAEDAPEDGDDPASPVGATTRVKARHPRGPRPSGSTRGASRCSGRTPPSCSPPARRSAVRWTASRRSRRSTSPVSFTDQQGRRDRPCAWRGSSSSRPRLRRSFTDAGAAGRPRWRVLDNTGP